MKYHWLLSSLLLIPTQSNAGLKQLHEVGVYEYELLLILLASISETKDNKRFISNKYKPFIPIEKIGYFRSYFVRPSVITNKQFDLPIYYLLESICHADSVFLMLSDYKDLCLFSSFFFRRKFTFLNGTLPEHFPPYDDQYTEGALLKRFAMPLSNILINTFTQYSNRMKNHIVLYDLIFSTLQSLIIGNTLRLHLAFQEWKSSGNKEILIKEIFQLCGIIRSKPLLDPFLKEIDEWEEASGAYERLLSRLRPKVDYIPTSSLTAPFVRVCQLPQSNPSLTLYSQYAKLKGNEDNLGGVLTYHSFLPSIRKFYTANEEFLASPIKAGLNEKVAPNAKPIMYVQKLIAMIESMNVSFYILAMHLQVDPRPIINHYNSELNPLKDIYFSNSFTSEITVTTRNFFVINKDFKEFFSGGLRRIIMFILDIIKTSNVKTISTKATQNEEAMKLLQKFADMCLWTSILPTPLQSGYEPETQFFTLDACKESEAFLLSFSCFQLFIERLREASRFLTNISLPLYKKSLSEEKEALMTVVNQPLTLISKGVQSTQRLYFKQRTSSLSNEEAKRVIGNFLRKYRDSPTFGSKLVSEFERLVLPEESKKISNKGPLSKKVLTAKLGVVSAMSASEIEIPSQIVHRKKSGSLNIPQDVFSSVRDTSVVVDDANNSSFIEEASLEILDDDVICLGGKKGAQDCSETNRRPQVHNNPVTPASGVSSQVHRVDRSMPFASRGLRHSRENSQDGMALGTLSSVFQNEATKPVEEDLYSQESSFFAPHEGHRHPSDNASSGQLDRSFRSDVASSIPPQSLNISFQDQSQQLSTTQNSLQTNVLPPMKMPQGSSLANLFSGSQHTNIQSVEPISAIGGGSKIPLADTPSQFFSFDSEAVAGRNDNYSIPPTPTPQRDFLLALGTPVQFNFDPSNFQLPFLISQAVTPQHPTLISQAATPQRPALDPQVATPQRPVLDPQVSTSQSQPPTGGTSSQFFFFSQNTPLLPQPTFFASQQNPFYPFTQPPSSQPASRTRPPNQSGKPNIPIVIEEEEESPVPAIQISNQPPTFKAPPRKSSSNVAPKTSPSNNTLRRQHHNFQGRVSNLIGPKNIGLFLDTLLATQRQEEVGVPTQEVAQLVRNKLDELEGLIPQRGDEDTNDREKTSRKSSTDIPIEPRGNESSELIVVDENSIDYSLFNLSSTTIQVAERKDSFGLLQPLDLTSENDEPESMIRSEENTSTISEKVFVPFQLSCDVRELRKLQSNKYGSRKRGAYSHAAEHLMKNYYGYSLFELHPSFGSSYDPEMHFFHMINESVHTYQRDYSLVMHNLSKSVTKARERENLDERREGEIAEEKRVSIVDLVMEWYSTRKRILSILSPSDILLFPLKAKKSILKRMRQLYSGNSNNFHKGFTQSFMRYKPEGTISNLLTNSLALVNDKWLSLLEL